MAEFLKGVFSKPAYLILIVGVGLLVLAAAGTLTINGQTVAVADLPWRIGLAAIGLLLTAMALALIYADVRNPRPGRPLKLKYDVFLASAMAAVEDEQAYEKQRADIARIKEALLARPGIATIYDSGVNLTFKKWEPGQVAAEVDLEALRHSRYFMLYFPEKLASSVLFEAGYAVGMGKPAVYIVPEREKLPFLMREMESVSRRYPQVRIWECASVDDIVSRIRLSGAHVFAGDEAVKDEASPAETG
jgi:hypothetical protein